MDVFRIENVLEELAWTINHYHVLDRDLSDISDISDLSDLYDVYDVYDLCDLYDLCSTL